MAFATIGAVLGASAATAAATGAVAVGTAASIGMGAAQMISAKKGQRQQELANLANKSPLYKGSKPIDAYYQEALNRYQASPYQSQQYLVGQKNVQRGMATGISGLQDRRSAIGGIARLAGTQSDALQNLGAAAESTKSQRFGQLGSATQLKAGEDYKKFNINEENPYERNLQLAQYRAQSAADQQQTGLGTIANAASNLGTYAASGAFGGKATGLTPDQLGQRESQSNLSKIGFATDVANLPKINQNLAPTYLTNSGFKRQQKYWNSNG